MPRPYVVLSLLFLLIVAVLGPRPNVVVVGTSHPTAHSAQVSQTKPTPDWLPTDKQVLSDPNGLTYEQINADKRHRWRLSYNTGR
jgi:hypothetical protein